MSAVLETAGMVAAGGAASFAGAFAAIRVHITYLTRDNARQDKRITALEEKVVVCERKADRAHDRIDHMNGVAS